MKIQKKEPIIKGKYILCYFLGNNPPHREFAEKLKKETGCKIVALTHLDEFVKSDEGYADETPYNIDPADFLNLIRNAEYVCTDSFHCSVFSILYKKSFIHFVGIIEIQDSLPTVVLIHCLRLQVLREGYWQVMRRLWIA